MSALEVLFFSLAYICGSFSSAVVVCQVFRLPDPRHTGSNNPGTTNVYRIGGRIPAVITLVLDVLKGVIPIWAATAFHFDPLALGLVGFFACLGHMFPLFFQFSGGKGVATALGALIAISPGLSLFLVSSWLIAVFVSGYSSLGAIISICLAPLLISFLAPQYLVSILMIVALILIRHHQNIRRLIAGEESKIWHKGRSKE